MPTAFRFWAAAAMAILGLASCGKKGAFVATCVDDERIPAGERREIDATALNFTQDLLANYVVALSKFWDDSRSKDADDRQLEAIEKSVIGTMHPTNPRVAHSYLVRSYAGSPGRMLCAVDLKRADGWVSMKAIPAAEQAHVLLTADARNNQWTLDVWLIHQKEQWKVHSFWINLSSLGALDSEALWVRGREEASGGHRINAALLLTAAAQVANRGPAFQLGLAQAIAKDLAAIDLPSEISGKAPFRWNWNGTTFNVIQVGPIALAGKLYVLLVQRQPAGKSPQELDASNHRLIDFFKHRFPEYHGVFSGIAARSADPSGHSGFATIDESALTKS
ncbi:MAG TPA: hypothetical protein VGL42_06920 [Opitutaceae bacterium]